MIAGAAALGVAGVAFMVGVSCLPDISTAGVAPFDGSSDGPPPSSGGFCGDGVIDFDAGEHCDPADAGLVGCTACQVTCDGGLLDPATDHCYFALAGNPKVDTAQTSCENAGGHLVTFASETEFASVLAWKKSDFWVGLQFDTAALAYRPIANVGEPGWSGRCEGCYAHVDAGAKNLPSALPDAGGIKATSCVLARGAVDSTWATIGCDLVTLPLGVVCEREPVGTTAHACNGGTCLSSRGARVRRYLYVSSSPGVTAQEAIDGCKGIGATLVVFETREEREQVARELLSFLPASPIPQLWIGLARVNGVWTWANGTSSDRYPSVWADQQPRGANTMFSWIELPASTYDTQLAHADDGTAKLPYLCELP